MTYAQAKAIAATAIPVIDMAPLHEGRRDSAQRIAHELLAAAQTVGFFYVRNHGIPRPLIARTDAVARRFFAMPLDQNQKV
jgi:isopenicillin N synthase-like dioxygenase